MNKRMFEFEIFQEPTGTVAIRRTGDSGFRIKEINAIPNEKFKFVKEIFAYDTFDALAAAMEMNLNDLFTKEEV